MLDIDIQQTYLRTKMNFVDQGFQVTVRTEETDKHRDRLDTETDLTKHLLPQSHSQTATYIHRV